MLLATVVDQSMWASQNGSSQWVQLGQGAGSVAIGNRTASVIFDPDNPQTFYEAGNYGPCVYKTTDDGNTFAVLGDATHCDSVSVDFTDPARQTILAGQHEGSSVFRSANGGQTWTDIGGNIPSSSGHNGFVLTIGSQTHLVGSWAGSNSGIFLSTNAGASFTQVFSGGDVRGRPKVSSDGIYWIFSGGFLKSTDQGATWNNIGGSGQVVASEAGFVELPDGRFVTLGYNTLMISSDRGVSWNSLGPTFPWSPWGVTYSTFRKAFYIWYFTCNFDGSGNPVPADAIVSWPFDYQAP
jgi:photosystem II stability/assembly factor-like uncharacterized protein